MESQKLFDEESDDRAYTESFDDVMTICPRPGLSAQERYEFRKNIKPSLIKGDQNILNPKDFDILVDRVNELEQELEKVKQIPLLLRYKITVYTMVACASLTFASLIFDWINDSRLTLITLMGINIGFVFLIYINSSIKFRFTFNENLRNKRAVSISEEIKNI